MSSSNEKEVKKKKEKKNWSIPKWAVIVILAAALGGGGFFGFLASSRSVTNISSSSLKNVLVEANDLVTTYNYYSGISKIENYRQINDWNIPFTGKQLVYVYQGKAVLGLDVDKINVDVRGKTIHVTCPPVCIISNSIDPDSIEVYDESTNLFNPIRANDVFDSVADAQKDAEEEMVHNGALQTAREASVKAVTQILEMFPGIKGEYTIEVVVPESDTLKYIDDSSDNAVPKASETPKESSAD